MLKSETWLDALANPPFVLGYAIVAFPNRFTRNEIIEHKDNIFCACAHAMFVFIIPDIQCYI